MRNSVIYQEIIVRVSDTYITPNYSIRTALCSIPYNNF